MLSSHQLARLLLELPDQPEVLCEDPGFVTGAEVSSYSGSHEDYPCVLLEIL